MQNALRDCRRSVQEVPLFHGLLRVEAVLEHSVALALRPAPARSVEAANRPAPVEALKRYRMGGEQKVTVQHVTVNEGGQAIVGHVRHGGVVGAISNRGGEGYRKK
jgi:hypothetical protein